MGAALVAPGTYMLKLAVIDDQGRRGSVEHRFDARLRTGGPFRFGSLMLMDGRVGGALTPRLSRASAASSALGYTEIYALGRGALPGCDDCLRDRRRAERQGAGSGAGDHLRQTSTPGRRLAVGEVEVKGLEPGDYVLRASSPLPGGPSRA